ncbi:MAG: NnrU family protein [Gammaproteobacteria bacterium]|jgi:uncharacterized membrane protein
MTTLVAGLVLFLGVHLLPTVPPLREGLRARLGNGLYKGFFSLVSLGGLLLIVRGMRLAPAVSVYSPPAHGYRLTVALMLVALILLVAAYVPSNVKRYTRHPMLWGVVLWSVGHLFANGDLAGLLLFASFGVYALVDMISANRRGAALQERRLPWTRDILVVVIGVAVYLVVSAWHARLMAG